MPLKTAADMTRPRGLELETERRQLRAARRLGRECSIDVRSTFLGAHALPPEAKGDKGAYIEALLPGHAASQCGRWSRGCGECGSASILPSLQKRRRSSSRLRARSDFPCACTPISSPILGARHWARASARSRPIISDTRTTRGVAAMAPCRHYRCALAGGFLFHSRAATSASRCVPFSRRADRARDDCNPGSSPLTSLLLAMNMGATLFRLTVDECSAGVTREAARALGIFNEIGSLESANGAISPSVISKGRGTSLSYGLQPTACARLAW
jgi:imidazolonepropionase